MRKVAVIGFGIEGRDAAKYFLAKNAQVFVFDKKPKDELDTSDLEKNKITWKCGEDYLTQGLQDFDLIVHSPGVRPDLPEIKEAVHKGAKLTSATKIFFEECKKPIIAVTGTKGKGTTASLINEALKASGFKTILLGNIGEPMLASLAQANESDWVILELSSFQIIDLDKSPHIAVVTNITSDHLDWHISQEEYEKAKEQLWKHQSKKDYLVINEDDKTSMRLAMDVPGTVKLYNGFNKKSTELKILGKHNIYNTNAALLAAELTGAGKNKVWEGITSFNGLEHRLELVKEVNRVLYVNDSYATNPEPTIAAINSFRQPRVLILGGSSKAANFDAMAEKLVNSNVRAAILIGDEAENIRQALAKAGFQGQIIDGGTRMQDIVKTASKFTEPGDVVLLSPACASFGLFKDYKDRGKQFKKAVLALN